jgi:hypothetical protein
LKYVGLETGLEVGLEIGLEIVLEVGAETNFLVAVSPGSEARTPDLWVGHPYAGGCQKSIDGDYIVLKKSE